MFNDTSIHEGHLHQNGTLIWFSIVLTLIVRIPSIHSEVMVTGDGSHCRTGDGRMGVSGHVCHR